VNLNTWLDLSVGLQCVYEVGRHAGLRFLDLFCEALHTTLSSSSEIEKVPAESFLSSNLPQRMTPCSSSRGWQELKLKIRCVSLLPYSLPHTQILESQQHLACMVCCHLGTNSLSQQQHMTLLHQLFVLSFDFSTDEKAFADIKCTFNREMSVPILRSLLEEWKKITSNATKVFPCASV
jgi:hypothetical protein